MVVTFGEMLMRLTPPGYKRLKQAQSFEVNFGGAEANTAVSLSQFGISVQQVTKLPQNDIGELCKSELLRYGVGTDYIAFDTSEKARLGIYFYEKGASQRPSAVVYDRANSSMALCKKEDFDWDSIFCGADWFHFTGITPAISDNAADILLLAVKKAKEKGITVSCDINYRAKLWSREKAAAVMKKYMPYVDVLFANTGSIYDVFSIGSGDYGKSCDIAECENAAKAMHEKYNIKTVALTMRKTLSASQNNWSALLYGEKTYLSKSYNIEITDRIGGGDSFAAGFIYGALCGMTEQGTVEFAAAASCLKHTVEGDFNLVTANEVLNLVNGDGSGNIKR